MRILPSSLLAALVIAACPKAPPPIVGVGGGGDEGEGEAGDEGEGEEGEGEEGEGEEGEGEGEGDLPDFPPTVLVMPEGNFCTGPCALQVGDTLQLTALAFIDGAVVEDPAVWSVDDEAVATVSSTGLVTGVAAGSATVTAEIDGVTGQAQLSISADAVATRIEVRPAQLQLAIGDSARITAEVFDGDDNVMADAVVTFSGFTDDTATVDATGLVTAVATGQTLILVQSGGASANVAVTVGNP